jgi:hypothetical protein
MLTNHPHQIMMKQKETLNRLHLNQVMMKTAVAARLIRQKSPSQSEELLKVGQGERSTLI